MQSITSYLRAPNPGYALLLNGKWGSGKSYTWSRYVESDLPRIGMKSITISIAGLESRADLDRALFMSSIERVTSSVAIEAATVIGKAALRFLNVDPSDVTLRADLNPNTTVVSLDDVERFAGDFEALFGFVVSLVDASFHCILIADENRALEKFPTYRAYKERVVGRTTTVKPALREFAIATINSFPNDKIRDLITGELDGLIAIVERADVDNLRTIRALLATIESLLLEFDADRLTNIFPLVRSVAFWMISTARDASNIALVARIFSISELGIIIHLRDAEKERGSDEFDKLIALLTETGFLDEVDRFVTSQELVKLINGHAVDFDCLGVELGLFPSEKKEPAEEGLLSRIRMYRNLSDAELQDGISQLEEVVCSNQIRSLGELYSAFVSLRALSRFGLTKKTPDQIVEEFLAVLDSYPIDGIGSSQLEFFEPPHDSADEAVRASLGRIEAAFNEREARSRRKLNVARILDGTEEVDDRSGPLFVGISASEFLAALRTSGIGAVARMIGLISGRLRISNGPQIFGEDSSFCAELSAQIEKSISKERPVQIIEAELMRLAHALDSFVASVERFNSGRIQSGVARP